MDKARTILLGNMHALMDKAVNTPEGYAQKIRDLNSAIFDLLAAKDEANGSITGLTRDRVAAESLAAAKRADATRLLKDNDPTNDQLALPLLAEANDLDAQLASYDEQIASLTSNRDDIAEAVEKLQAHSREMQSNLQKLRITQAATKAKTRASSAVESASGAVSAAGDVDYDSIERAITHDGDVADARFDRVMGQLNTPDRSAADAVRMSKAQSDLDALRAQIEAEKS
jgi:phage shock protein A